MEIKAIREMIEEPILTDDGEVVIATLKEGETADLTPCDDGTIGVEIENDEENKVLTVKIKGEVFTTYTYSDDLPKQAKALQDAIWKRKHIRIRDLYFSEWVT